MADLITVIPVYNGERYLATTLDSVAKQTEKPDRVVIIDNCSTDNTKSVVESFSGVKCEWRQNSTNLGLFGNLNKALEFTSETEFLHLLHADDRVKPEFYRVAKAALAPIAGRSLFRSEVQFIDREGKPVDGSAKGVQTSSVVREANDFISARAELRPIYFPGVLLKTARLRSPCSFLLDMPQLADHVFWGEWASHCVAIIETSAVLAEYRVHPDADTARNTRNLQAWVADEWRAMELVAGLIRESPLKKALRTQKQKLLFAARSSVKLRQLQDAPPELKESIRDLTRQRVSTLHWLAGSLAAKTRDQFTPPLGTITEF
jgi:glycosyltransferase involved in cell wall biosynthesis